MCNLKLIYIYIYYSMLHVICWYTIYSMQCAISNAIYNMPYTAHRLKAMRNVIGDHQNWQGRTGVNSQYRLCEILHKPNSFYLRVHEREASLVLNALSHITQCLSTSILARREKKIQPEQHDGRDPRLCLCPRWGLRRVQIIKPSPCETNPELATLIRTEVRNSQTSACLDLLC